MQELFQSVDWDIRAATNIRPETPQELHQWIKTYCRTDIGEKISIPYRRMCHGHNAPFEFVADAFFGTHNKQFAHAPRSGGKTLDLGLISFCGMYHYGRGSHPLNILNIGAIQDQANKCFSYTASIWQQEEFYQIAGKGILKQSITLPNGTDISIEVATIKGVNSPHVPWLHLDEWELWDWDIGQQAFSIPQSSGPHKATVRMASTQKFAFGNVQRFKDEAAKKGFQVYKWCIWETIEQCRDRSCSSCPIYEWPDREGGRLCGGTAKRSIGFYTIDDFIDKVKTLDRSTLEEEWLCLRPSREGLVFGRDYSEDYHRIKFEIPYSSNLPLYLTIDQGFTNPFAVLIIQDDRPRDQLRFIDELYQTQMIPEKMARQTADHLEALGVEKNKKIPVVYDLEDPAAARTFVKHLESTNGRKYYGILRQPAGKIDLDEWLRLCRRRLKIAVGKPPRAIISSRCTWFPYEFTQYRFPVRRGEERPSTEKPLDKDNHAISGWYRFEAWLNRPGKMKSGDTRFM